MPASSITIKSVPFFFSSRRRHTRYWRDWSSDVCSSDLHSGSDTVHLDFRRKGLSRTLREHVQRDRKSTRLNSSHANISYAVFCLKKKKHLIIFLQMALAFRQAFRRHNVT